MDSKSYARAYAANPGYAAGAAVPGAKPARSLRSIARAKLRASKAESAAYLARGGSAVTPLVGRRGLPPGQAGAIARAVTDCAACTPAASGRAASMGRIAVWDLPTRVFHWSLVLAVTVAIVTGLIGGDWMRVHGNAGIAIVGLLGFRLVWGIAGAAHARFAGFAPTPARLRAYLGGRWQGHGHNPLGALSVFALLSLLAVQTGTGLVGNDEIAFQGPLAQLVDETRSLQLTGLHQQLAYVLMGFIGLHVLAIVAYLIVRKTDLVRPMVTGWKPAGDAAAKAPVATATQAQAVPVQGAIAAAGTAAGAHAGAAGRWRWSALVAALAVGGVAMALASGAGLAPEAGQAAVQAATPATVAVSTPASTEVTDGAAAGAVTGTTAGAPGVTTAAAMAAQAAPQPSTSAAPAW
jgi:cytochrome b